MAGISSQLLMVTGAVISTDKSMGSGFERDSGFPHVLDHKSAWQGKY